MKIRKLIVAGVFAALPAAAIAADASAPTKLSISVGGSGLWLLANISYAGMRAQNSPSAGWRIVAFIFGFPGTLISLSLIHI